MTAAKLFSIDPNLRQLPDQRCLLGSKPAPRSLKIKQNTAQELGTTRCHAGYLDSWILHFHLGIVLLVSRCWAAVIVASRRVFAWTARTTTTRETTTRRGRPKTKKRARKRSLWHFFSIVLCLKEGTNVHKGSEEGGYSLPKQSA